MPRRFRIRQVDVFTDRPLAGNPLAVFVDADDLSDDEMQALASETNLSETTFVLPPTADGRRAGADYRIRIFTPGMELPFAGHPAIGTCWVLADEGRFALASPRTVVRQESALGVFRLSLAVSGAVAAPEAAVAAPPAGAAAHGGMVIGEVTMTQAEPELLHELDDDEVEELCATLEVTEAAIGWDGRGPSGRRAAARPAVISTGLPHLIVPFRDREEMDEVDREREPALAGFVGGFGADSVALIAPGGTGAIPDADASVRLFDAERFRIDVDPATGAAAGPIAVFLAQVARARARTYRVVLEQGTEVGRPSRLVAEVDVGGDGRAGEVRVAGRVVPIMDGWVTLP